MNKLASFLIVLLFGLQIGGIALMSNVLSLVQVSGTYSQFLIAHGINAPILGGILQVIEMVIVFFLFRKYIKPSTQATLSVDEKNSIIDELEARVLKKIDKPGKVKVPMLKGRAFKKALFAAIMLKIINVGEPVGDADAGK